MKKNCVLFVKKHYLILLALSCIIFLITFAYSEHKGKQMYKNQISYQLRVDLGMITNNIVDMDRLYDSILSTDQYNYNTTKTEADFLFYRSHEIVSSLYKWFLASLDLGYVDKEPTPMLGNSLSAINSYFQMADPKQPLTNTDKKIITTFQAFNDELIEALFTKSDLFQRNGESLDFKDKYRENELQISDPVWLETLELLEETSVQFLKEHNLNKLSDVIH